MDKADLLVFLRSYRVAVEASASPEGLVQAAVIGIAVSDSFEVIFDTIDATRKAHNLRRNPQVALVIGGWVHGDERTVQYEGTVDEPQGAELDRVKEIYYGSFPDGHERASWPGLIYMRVTPTWIRYIDHGKSPRETFEFSAQQL